MSSRKQIEANRLNAQKSTGPRSVEGRGVSSQNALKTGIDAKSLIIKGENPADLEAITAEYYQRFCPQTPEQRHFVDCLIRDDWQLRRLSKVDAEIWDHAMNDAYKLDEYAPLGHVFQMKDTHFIRLQRRIDSTHRSYKSALHELQRLQAEQQPEIGGADASVCQPEPEGVDSPADPTHDRDSPLPREGAVDSPGPAPEQSAENTATYPQIGFVPSPSLEPQPVDLSGNASSPRQRIEQALPQPWGVAAQVSLEPFAQSFALLKEAVPFPRP